MSEELRQTMTQSLIVALDAAGQPWIGDLVDRPYADALNAARLHGSSQLVSSHSGDTTDNKSWLAMLKRIAEAVSEEADGKFDIDCRWLGVKENDDKENPKYATGLVVDILFVRE